MTAPPAAAIPDEQLRIPVVSSFDDNFAPVYSVLLCSLLRHFSPDTAYELIILENGVSDESKTILLDQIASSKNVSLRFIEMEGAFDDYANSHRTWSRSTFNRLAIPEVLPEYSKVVYLDSDCIVLTDISRLYEIDVSPYYAAACLDLGVKIDSGRLCVARELGNLTIHEYFAQHLQLSEMQKNSYFNSGVMLLNIDSIRRDNLHLDLVDLYSEKHYAHVDQDIFNIAFANNVLILDNKWNFVPIREDWLVRLEPAFQQAYRRSRRDVKILHFAGQAKPWSHDRIEFSGDFWSFCEQSPFFERIRLAFLEKQIQDVRRQRDELRDHLRNVTDSRCWKITAPLRSLYRQARR